MSMPPDKTNLSAGSPDRACKGCHSADKCRNVWSIQTRGPLSPVGLCFASVLAFLLPILSAIIAGATAGAYLSNENNLLHWQILAVLAGLVAGGLLARLIMPSIRKRFYDRGYQKNNSCN